MIECKDDDELWNVNLMLWDKVVIFKIDIGVDILVISEGMFYLLNFVG